MEVECYAKFHPERFHVTANTSSSQLYHFKSCILALVAAQVFSVVMVSRLFGISRKTFYNSELTPCRHNTNRYAALQAFAIFTFTLCST